MLPFLRQRRVCFVGVCFQRNASLVNVCLVCGHQNVTMSTTYACKISVSIFDVEVEEIKHNPVGQVTEAPVVHNQSLPCVDHLGLKFSGTV